MMPSTNTEPIKPRSGWRMLGLMTLGMVILTIGGGFWWYFSDSDLEAVREQARLQGRPLSWSDMGLKPADPERLRMWKRVTELTEQLKSYQTINYSPKKTGPVFKMWGPIPQEMRDYHQGLDGAAIAELTDLLDRLGDQPLVFHDQLTYTTNFPEIATTRELLRFTQERLIIAEGIEVGIWKKRMLSICHRFSSDTLMLFLVRNALIGTTIDSLTYRFAALKQVDPSIASEILTMTQTIHANLLHALDGEFLMLLDCCTRRTAYTNEWYAQLILRCGRYRVLSAYLDTQRELQFLNDQGSLAWARTAEKKLIEEMKGIPNPSKILKGLLLPAWNTVIRMNQKTILRGRLIAAELQGQPWPIDTFDATGAVLRPITRDGRIIAAYSVGDDGIDQGGNEKKDHVFPLYAKP